MDGRQPWQNDQMSHVRQKETERKNKNNFLIGCLVIILGTSPV